MTAVSITHSTVATLPDQAGAEVNASEWNDDHDLNLPNDATQYLDGSGNWSVPGGAAPSTFEYRLSGTSGLAVTTADVTAIGTLYLTPYIGKRLSLYTSSVWTKYEQGEKSLSLSGLIKGVGYDIFVYDSSGTVTLEAVAWKKVASTSSPTSGSSKTLNLTDTATLAVGMDVTVRDGSNSEVARITAVVTNTSITVDALANSYTTPDVYGYRARVTALTTQDGVLVKSGSTNKRYAGFIVITAATAGETEDSVGKRLIQNYYNRVQRPLAYPEAANSWTHSTTTLRQQQGAKTAQVVVANGIAEDPVSLTLQSTMTSSGATVRVGIVAIGRNSTTTYIGNPSQLAGTSSWNMGTVAVAQEIPPIGRNYYAWLEQGAGSDTQTWYGDNGSATGGVQTGLNGYCWA